MQHVLVTGGAGYIGSVVTPLLLQAGFRVTVLDRLLFPVNGVESISHPGFRFIRGNIGDQHLVNSIMSDVDHVVHLAAIVGEPACNKWPELAEETNARGSRILLETAENHDIRRFVFASTCSNYGVMEDQDILDEDSPLQPISAYARHKVEIEQAVLSGRVAVPVVLRFATAFGLSPRMRFDLTVNHFTRDACTGICTEVYGGDFWRPYVHTMDIGRSILLALTLPEEVVSGSVMNVGTTAENFTKSMLTGLIQHEIPSYRFVIHKVTGSDPRNYRVDFSRIAERWGFKARMNVRTGIRELKLAFADGAFPDPDIPGFANHLEIRV